MAEASTAHPAYPQYRFEGPPSVVGRAHGVALGGLIDRSIQLYRELFTELAGLDARSVRRFAATIRRQIATYDVSLLEEMDGIAAGAEVDPHDIVALNARSDILHLAGNRIDARALLEASSPDSCTSAVLLPPATADGRVLLLQNWDIFLRCQPQTVVLDQTLPGEPRILFFTEAGILVRSGFNEHGIGITGNAMRSDSEFSRGLGIPETVVRRRVLRQRTYADAIRQVVVTPRSHSINHILAHCDGAGIDLEATPSAVFRLVPDRGILVHSNHFQSPAACLSVSDENVRVNPSTLYRDCRVREALSADSGSIQVGDAKAALQDHFGYPDAVCQHPSDPDAARAVGTVASMIMDLTNRELHIAPAPVCRSNYHRYSFEEAGPGVRRQAR